MAIVVHLDVMLAKRKMRSRELADHVYIMDRGEIVTDGPADILDTADARRHLTV